MSAIRLAAVSVLFIGLAILVGCSSGPQNKPAPEQPKPAAETKKEPVFYTALQCLKQLEGQAHLWATDAKPFHLESDLTSESTGKDGKSTIWNVWFASPSRRSVRTFTCSGSRQPDAPAFGLSRGIEMPYDPKFVLFDEFLLKTDSDKAFAVAQDHGGESLFKKDPQQPVTYLVEMGRGQTVPQWFVIYGKNMKESKGIGVINATTGAFVKAGK